MGAEKEQWPCLEMGGWIGGASWRSDILHEEPEKGGMVAGAGSAAGGGGG